MRAGDCRGCCAAGKSRPTARMITQRASRTKPPQARPRSGSRCCGLTGSGAAAASDRPRRPAVPTRHADRSRPPGRNRAATAGPAGRVPGRRAPWERRNSTANRPGRVAPSARAAPAVSPAPAVASQRTAPGVGYRLEGGPGIRRERRDRGPRGRCPRRLRPRLDGRRAARGAFSTPLPRPPDVRRPPARCRRPRGRRR